jgi:soluble lytic murein transglycosylase-like protein
MNLLKQTLGSLLLLLLLLNGGAAYASYIEKCLRNDVPDRSCARIQADAERWAGSIEEAANKVGVDPLLLKAVVAIESHFNAKAYSPGGPMGLVQILPSTAYRLGFSKEQLKLPEVNLEAGATYLKIQLDKFNDNYLAVVAYNLGGKTESLNKRAQRHANAYAGNVISLYEYFQLQSF